MRDQWVVQVRPSKKRKVSAYECFDSEEEAVRFACRLLKCSRDALRRATGPKRRPIVRYRGVHHDGKGFMSKHGEKTKRHKTEAEAAAQSAKWRSTTVASIKKARERRPPLCDADTG